MFRPPYPKTRTILLMVLLTSSSWAAEPPPPRDLQLPSIGDAAGIVMSPQEEDRLGAAFMRNIRRSLDITTDPEVDEYIQSLGYRLVAGGEAHDRHYSFFVVQDPAINAFAGPGGYIGVHSGLILAADNERELAAVLAHEIAHVNQRHLLRAVESSNKLSLPATAALIAAIVIAGHNAQAAQAAITATVAGTQQAAINFTRNQEQEADRVGLQILAGAGYDPRAMPAFFEQLQQSTRFAEGGVPEFLRTHPVTVSRIADSRNRAEQYPQRVSPEAPNFDYTQAKLRVLTSKDPEALIRYFQDQLTHSASRHNTAALRYGLALAQRAAHRYDAARKTIKELLAADPERIALLIANAEIDAADGKVEIALKTCEQALQVYPRNYPLTVTYARMSLQAGDPTEARLLLQEHLRYRDGNPLLYDLLAQSEENAGFPVEAQQALAEQSYLNGQTRNAIEHLKTARSLVQENDFYRAARLDARLKEMEEVAREEPAL